MPFGLVNTPAHSQKTDLIVVDKGDDLLVVYIDDILIGGSSHEKAK